MNILIVEDHPMAATFYQTVLMQSVLNKEITNIVKVNTSEQAYNLLASSATEHVFNLVILDYQLPHYKEKAIYTGSDLAILIKKSKVDCKIVMITAITQVILIFDILKKVKPHGFAIKNDVDAEDVIQIIRTVLDGNQYYSASVRECASQIYKAEIFIDDDNRQIVYNLSKGYKVKDLPSLVAMPLSTIQKRIVNMKNIFGIASDGSLIAELSLRGYI